MYTQSNVHIFSVFYPYININRKLIELTTSILLQYFPILIAIVNEYIFTCLKEINCKLNSK